MLLLWFPFRRKKKQETLYKKLQRWNTNRLFTPLPWSPCSLELSSVRSRSKEYYSKRLWGSLGVAWLLKKVQLHIVSGTLDGEGWGQHLGIFLIRLPCSTDGVNIIRVVFNVLLGVAMSGYPSNHCLVAWTWEGRYGHSVGFLYIFWYSSVHRYCPQFTEPGHFSTWGAGMGRRGQRFSLGSK